MKPVVAALYLGSDLYKEEVATLNRRPTVVHLVVNYLVCGPHASKLARQTPR